MARRPVGALSFEIPSTAALVECTNWNFADVNSEPNTETISCDILIRYNGIAPQMGDRIAVARNATLAQKQAAVRLRVNQLLDPYEPGNTLNNANIQITGLPV